MEVLKSLVFDLAILDQQFKPELGLVCLLQQTIQFGA
jgi:hypothetical protein